MDKESIDSDLQLRTRTIVGPLVGAPFIVAVVYAISTIQGASTSPTSILYACVLAFTAFLALVVTGGKYVLPKDVEKEHMSGGDPDAMSRAMLGMLGIFLGLAGLGVPGWVMTVEQNFAMLVAAFVVGWAAGYLYSKYIEYIYRHFWPERHATVVALKKHRKIFAWWHLAVVAFIILFWLLGCWMAIYP